MVTVSEWGGRGQVLYEGTRTRVLRGPTGAGVSVIAKEYRGPDAARRLRHERSVLRRLAGVDGVPRLVPDRSPPGTLLLADTGARPVTDEVLPLDVRDVVGLGLGLATVLGAVHRAGIIHRDVSPANVLRTGPAPHVELVDFEAATTFTDARSGQAGEPAGALAYAAPELTGRAGRPVDQRADLYALGATLFELATGEPPFATDDPLRLAHDLMARRPRPTHEINPNVPPILSAIIARLLEKEPDHRYQSADGLRYDLRRLASEGDSAFPLGERDLPLRFEPPSRVVDRAAERARLADALDDAIHGTNHVLLISGASGVGKSALADELRPMVAAAGGWFVRGTFDRYRRDPDFDGLRQAFRALGRLLLAEPEEELARLRDALRTALGSRIPLLAAVLPEFGVLLGGDTGAPEADDPLLTQVRLQHLGPDLLRVIASRQRPVVMVVDNLQWAGATPLGGVDAILADRALNGALVVGVVRDDGVGDHQPLDRMLERWHHLGVSPQHLPVDNLPPEALADLIEDMLGTGGSSAGAGQGGAGLDWAGLGGAGLGGAGLGGAGEGGLAVDSSAITPDLVRAVDERTGGNPFDTIELVNALRRDGALDADRRVSLRAVVDQLGRAEVADVLIGRIDALPEPTRSALDAMACLGSEVERGLLRRVVGTAGDDVLTPALDEGLLVTGSGDRRAVRFRHDRIREAVVQRLGADRVADLRLALGRRLATEPEWRVVAAEQYLAAGTTPASELERRVVAELYREAALTARVVSNHALVERYLTASLALADPPNPATGLAMRIDRHASLYVLGRLDEADEVFHAVQATSDPVTRAGATCVQISSLTNRGRLVEAVALGLDLLRELGFEEPDHPDPVDPLPTLYAWADEPPGLDDAHRPDETDARIRAVAQVISRTMAPAFFVDQAVMVRLCVTATGLWSRYGPSGALVSALSSIAVVMAAMGGQYRAGRRAVRRVLAAGEARGYEPETSQARMMYALGTGHWFVPLEPNLREAERARHGLVRGGDPQNACFTYVISVLQYFECAPTLDAYLSEVEAALAFAARTGNEHLTDTFQAYNTLARVLRGEPGALEAFDAYAPRSADDPVTRSNVTTIRGLHAAISGDPDELAAQAATLMDSVRFAPASYTAAISYLLWALSRAGMARRLPAQRRAVVFRELDAARAWLAERAEDAPANFAHLVALIDAERAWAAGDPMGAAAAFDRALRSEALVSRPWHRAVTAERAARLYLELGQELVGQYLLRQARQALASWGANRQVRRLEREFPFLRAHPGAVSTEDVRTSPAIMSGAIDLLAILDAARALSSETNLDRLRRRVVDTLSALTGATTVHVLLYHDEEHRWYVPGPDRSGGILGRPIAEDDGRRLPLSAVRYAERTQGQFVVADATRDDRFARDSYLSTLDYCSLLAVPVRQRGRLQALLLLENTLIRGAFSGERLDAVNLISGQLAIAFDNALAYASLERKVAERTAALNQANQRLALLSVTDPLTQLANRRRLEEVLDHHWNDAAGSRHPVSVAMVDVDHFKTFNDRFGHPAGDECLRRVADTLRSHAAEADLVARYGGEEFAVVMPGVDRDTAAEQAEQLREAVADLVLPDDLAPGGRVTVSIGVVTTIPTDDRRPHQLLAEADACLYEAKQRGRNRIATRASG